MGVFERFVSVLNRSAVNVGDKLDKLLSDSKTDNGDDEIQGETIEAVEEILLEADLGVCAVSKILEDLTKGGNRRQEVSLRDCVKQSIVDLFTLPEKTLKTDASPHVVFVVGVNGAGKTTTVGKLAHRFLKEGRSPLVCAADTFRAAAVSQLKIWTDRIGVDLVKTREGGDAAAIVFDSIKAAKARGNDVVLVDTAGRLHTRVDLMNELRKIYRVASRASKGAPHEVLLVLDATVGQNGVNQAKQFIESVDATGVILTKLDGTAKGGIAVAITSQLGLPIKYVGVGESERDLIAFSAPEYVDALFEQRWSRN
tara:strand:+ start:2159 stop:3094 length:936 start_codon:yes stop_codon:yes gene_type:complete